MSDGVDEVGGISDGVSDGMSGGIIDGISDGIRDGCRASIISFPFFDVLEFDELLFLLALSYQYMDCNHKDT
jgi:hypothetical protein